MKKLLISIFVLLLATALFTGCKVTSSKNDQKDDSHSEDSAAAIITHTVTIDGEVHTVVDGQRAPLVTPDDTEDELFSFWCVDGEEYDVDLPVTEDLEITSVFRQRNVFVITVDGEEYPVKEGFTVAAPETPERDGMTFLGWFSKNKPFDFSLPVTSDAVVTSLWKTSDVDVTDQDYVYLGFIGGNNAAKWDMEAVRTDDKIILRFTTDGIPNTNDIIDMFLQVGAANVSTRNSDSLSIRVYPSGKIYLYNYPNNVKTTIASGSDRLANGITVKTVTGEKTQTYVSVPYSAISALSASGFEADEVLGLAFNSTENASGKYDYWTNEELKGYDGNARVTWTNPRDYLRFARRNFLFEYEDNTVDTAVTDELGNYSFAFTAGNREELSLDYAKARFFDENRTISLSDALYYTVDVEMNYDPATANLGEWTNGSVLESESGDVMLTEASLRIADDDYDEGLRLTLNIKKSVFDDMTDEEKRSVTLDLFGKTTICDITGFVTETTIGDQTYLTDCVYVYGSNSKLFGSAQTVTVGLFSNEKPYSATTAVVVSEIAVTAAESYSDERAARLIADYATFSYVLDGGEPTSVVYGQKITEPATPEYAYYLTFDGWKTTDGEIWNFNEDVITSDLILKASFSFSFDENAFVSLGTIGGTNAPVWNLNIQRTSDMLVLKTSTEAELILTSPEGVGLFLQLKERVSNYNRTDKTFLISAYVGAGNYEANYPGTVKRNITLTGVTRLVYDEDGTTTVYTVIPYSAFEEYGGLDASDDIGFTFTADHVDKWDVYYNESYPGFNEKALVDRDSILDYLVLSADGVVSEYSVTIDESELTRRIALSGADKDGLPFTNNVAELYFPSATFENVEVGKHLFTNRLTQGYDIDGGLPAFAYGYKYGFATIDAGVAFEVVKAGYVVLIEPNSSAYTSLKAKISADGWTTVLLAWNKTGKLTDNLNYLVKWCEAGESYNYGKYNIPICLEATFDVTLSAPENGSLTASATTAKYHGGVTVFATPDEGYTVVSLIVNGVNVGAQTSYVISDVTTDISVSATFGLIPETSFTVNFINGNDVIASYKLEEGDTANYGGETPSANGKLFVGWSKTQNGTVTSDFIVYEQTDFYAVFEDIPYAQLGTIGQNNADTTAWNAYIYRNEDGIYVKNVTSNEVDLTGVKDGVDYFFHFGARTKNDRGGSDVCVYFFADGSLSAKNYSSPAVTMTSGYSNVADYEDGKTAVYGIIPKAFLTNFGVDVDNFSELEISLSILSEVGSAIDPWVREDMLGANYASAVDRMMVYDYITLTPENTLEEFDVYGENAMATIRAHAGYIATTGASALMFSDRTYTFGNNVKGPIQNKYYVAAGIEAGAFGVLSDGYVILIVPSSYSAVKTAVSSDGWSVVYKDTDKSGSNDILWYYLKHCKAGESYAYGKWTTAVSAKADYEDATASFMNFGWTRNADGITFTVIKSEAFVSGDTFEVYYQVGTTTTSRNENTFTADFMFGEAIKLSYWPSNKMTERASGTSSLDNGMMCRIEGNVMTCFMPYSAIGIAADDDFLFTITAKATGTVLGAAKTYSWPDWFTYIDGTIYKSVRGNPTTYVAMKADGSLKKQG